jgi:hypothetical protein
MTVARSTFTGNRLTMSIIMQGGGAIWNRSGNLTVTDSDFTGNSTEAYHDVETSGGPTLGGAILNGAVGEANSGSLTVSGSTFDGNSAEGVGGAIASSLPLTLTNDTFEGNGVTTATSELPYYDIGTGGFGGAVYLWAATDLTTNLTNNTFAENTAVSGDNLYTWQNEPGVSHTLNLFNNLLVKGSTGGNCATVGTPTLTSSHNLADDATCSAGFTNSTSILLGSLGDYGGVTATVPLLPASSAINAGDSCPTTDQRGESRVGVCDIGAFESQGFTLTKSGGDGQSALINTAFSNPLDVTVTSTHSEPVDGGQVTFAAQGLTANASVTGSPATIGTVTSGQASVMATANGTAGGYNVTASAAGADSVNFALTNLMACSSAITVTTNADSGAGSLRQAIADVCAGGTIDFDDDYTIPLASELTIDKNVTIDATGHSITVSGDSDNDGDGDVRVFHVQNGVTATLTHLSVVNGTVGGGFTCASNNCGGGIYNQGTLTVQTSTVSDSSALYGGGIANQGALTVIDSTLTDNYGDYGGGGIYNDGVLMVLTSTLSGNWTNYSGGGIYNDSGGLTVQTSTLADNRAGAGGGIANDSGTALKVYNSTLSGNRASNGGGGILTYGTWLDLSHTIIANSPEGGDCVHISGGGGWVSSGYSLIESTGVDACGLNSDYFTVLGVDPLLGALADHGGPTRTFALLPGSPAIDAGAATCSSPDQRGVTRPQGTACDIGAFESRGFTLTKTGGDNQSTLVNTDFPNLLTLMVSSPFGEPVGGGLVTFTPPASGASAAITSSPMPITSGAGTVDVIATANGTPGGPYNVAASASGAASVNFSLTNNAACSDSITVMNTSDSGAGSLRQAIADVCVDGTITFAPSLSGQTISTQLVITKNLTIDGSTLATPVTIGNAPHVFRIISVNVTLDSLIIANGSTGDDGGGIFNDRGVLTVMNSTFSGNGADWGGGAIYNYQGTLTVTNSAFSGNSARDGGRGGGIYNSGGMLMVTNSTFSGNSATSEGGGIYNSGGTATVTNSTFSDNSAVSGGGIYNDDGTLTVTNSIIANSPTGGNCGSSFASISGLNNLTDDGTCGSAFTTSPFILLGAFGNYGGSTNTFPLLPGSPAIDAGNAATCAAAPVNSLDQRGVTRPAACDIGAFESQGFALTKTGGDDQSTIVSTAFSNPLEVTVTSTHGEPVNGGLVTFAPQGVTANASVTGSPATIGTVTSGKASVMATANGTAGGYNVTASAAGATSVNFALTNLPDCANNVTVTSNADNGAGSLRQAIANVCADGTIDFAGDTTIALASTLTIDKNLTIDGTGYDVTISGDTNGDDTGDVRVFWVNSGVTADLNSLTITRGYALNSDGVGGAGGGGIYNFGTLTVANSVLSYNTVEGEYGNGGAIDSYLDGDGTEGTLTVSNTIFRGNSAFDGGAIQQGAELTITDSTFVENSSSWSGGAINCNSGSLLCTISDSTFSSNTNTGDTYGGGAIAFFNNGVKTVANSTFTGNISTTDGGAIYAFTGTVKLDSVSIVGNTTQNGNGGGLANEYSTTLISNTIIANNVDNGGESPDCSGGISSGGYNLIKNLTGCAFTPVTGDITGVDPRLGSLGDYGGSTETLPLLPSSPAIDAGSSCAVADQRGVTRPTACDIGAFESQGFTLTKTGGDNQSTAVNTDFGAPLTLSVTSAFGEPVNGGQVTFTVPGSGASASITSSPYTISSGVVSVDAAANGIVGGYNVNASASGANSVDFALRNMGTPVITWANPANIVYGTPLGATQLNATADVPGAFTYTPDTGAILDAGTHTLHVDFTPTDTTNYANASKDVSITVTQAAPVITWANPANIVYGTPLSATQLNATADMPGAFTYTPTSGAVLNVGTHTLHVDFMPTDTTNYANASKDVSISVTQAAPVITWSNPANIVYGTPLGATQLNATADVSGAFTYAPASGAVLNVGTHTLHVDFIPNDTANYANAAKDVSLTVLSVTRVDPSPTDLFSVNFTVIFSEPVSGVDVTGPDFDDFALDTFGLTDPLITAVTAVSEVEYTVTVDTGSGNGTLGLDVLATGAIVDASNNPLTEGFTGGEVYQVLKSAIFADVPNTYWANDFIERLYLSRITGGCGVTPLIYCPNQGVTRAQLAVFLLRSMYGAPYLPPEVGDTTGFNDVSIDHWAAAWIKQLAAEGITGGCGDGNYCPNQVVNRAQLAVMLLRAEHGVGYIPPAASGLFSDVPADHWAAAWIEQLVAEGLTSGCGGNNYCPNQPVTRAQMAVFLVSAFNLP